MSGSRKVWEVHDKDVDLGSVLVRAETAGKAKYQALMWEDFGLEGCGYMDLRAERAPWLDCFDGGLSLDDPDVTMACLRHGWMVENQGFSMDPVESGIDLDLIDKTIVEQEGEAGYKRYAEIIGATYPDRYRQEKEA